MNGPGVANRKEKKLWSTKKRKHKLNTKKSRN